MLYVIVAPIFLDICLYVFVAWVNLKYIFDSDILIENIVIFAKRFLNTKPWSWILLCVVMNVLCFVSLLFIVR